MWNDRKKATSSLCQHSINFKSKLWNRPGSWTEWYSSFCWRHLLCHSSITWYACRLWYCGPFNPSKKAAIPLWYLRLSISMVQLISEGPHAVCEDRRNFIQRTGTDLWCTPGVYFMAPPVCSLQSSGWRYHLQTWFVFPCICRWPVTVYLFVLWGWNRDGSGNKTNWNVRFWHPFLDGCKYAEIKHW